MVEREGREMGGGKREGEGGLKEMGREMEKKRGGGGEWGGVEREGKEIEKERERGRETAEAEDCSDQRHVCRGKHRHQWHQDDGGHFFDNGADACSGNAFNYPGYLGSLFGLSWVQSVYGQPERPQIKQCNFTQKCSHWTK